LFLRRSHGSALYNAGVDIGTVAAQMGHKNPATTARHYAHKSEKTKRAALAKVSM